MIFSCYEEKKYYFRRLHIKCISRDAFFLNYITKDIFGNPIVPCHRFVLFWLKKYKAATYVFKI